MPTHTTACIVAKDVAAQRVPSRVLRGSIGAAQVGNFLGDSDDEEGGEGPPLLPPSGRELVVECC